MAESPVEAENSTQPLLPMLKAFRRRKLRISLLANSARVWIGKDEAVAVEAFDLVSTYADGQLPLEALVKEVLRRLKRTC